MHPSPSALSDVSVGQLIKRSQSKLDRTGRYWTNLSDSSLSLSSFGRGESGHVEGSGMYSPERGTSPSGWWSASAPRVDGWADGEASPSRSKRPLGRERSTVRVHHDLISGRVRCPRGKSDHKVWVHPWDEAQSVRSGRDACGGGRGAARATRTAALATRGGRSGGRPKGRPRRVGGGTQCRPDAQWRVSDAAKTEVWREA